MKHSTLVLLNVDAQVVFFSLRKNLEQRRFNDLKLKPKKNANESGTAYFQFSAKSDFEIVNPFDYAKV